jgi:thymidine kinase
LEKTFLSYRFYLLDKIEVPALFFDPLILVGGDVVKDSPSEPNYESRCASHHFLLGKEYTYCYLIPLARRAVTPEGVEELKEELRFLNGQIKLSYFYESIVKYEEQRCQGLDLQKILEMPYLAEKALQYLFQEENLLTRDSFIDIIEDLNLDKGYLNRILAGMGRPLLS